MEARKETPGSVPKPNFSFLDQPRALTRCRYADFYTQEPAYVDENGVSEETYRRETCILTYPEFFKEGKPQYTTLKAALQHATDDENKNQRYHRACEVIKGLFQTDMRIRSGITRLQNMPSMKKIIESYGNKIMAHGVEEAKGGITTLLLICLSGAIRVPRSSWGNFNEHLSSMPNTSPLAHGPYYLVASTNAATLERDQIGSRASLLSNMQYIVLPFQENIDTLNALLSKTEKSGLITQQEANACSQKMVTYDQLLAILQHQHQATPTMPQSRTPSKKGRG